MDYGYLVNNGGGNQTLYYYANGSIMRRVIENDVPGRTESIAHNVMPFVFVTLRQGVPVIIYQLENGDVVLSCGDQSRVIQSGGRAAGEVFLSAVFSGRRMRLIYMNGGSLVTQSSDEHGSADAVILDEPVGNLPYRLIPIVDGGYYLIYKRRVPEQQLGYRELTAASVGDYKRIFSTGFDIGDSSVCTADDIVHFVFVSMSRFAVRVMYCRRYEGSFSKPKNLWEGSRCSAVCIAADGSDVFVWWESGGHVYESVSHNSGESFSQCVRRGNIRLMAKILHLGGTGCGVSELMLTDSCKLYAPDEVKELIKLSSGSKPPVQSEKKEERSENNAGFFRLREELARKQEQIDKLAYALKCKNEEISKTEFNLRQKNAELKAEISRINAEKSAFADKIEQQIDYINDNNQ